jgi:hypothetical protein
MTQRGHAQRRRLRPQLQPAGHSNLYLCAAGGAGRPPFPNHMAHEGGFTNACHTMHQHPPGNPKWAERCGADCGQAHEIVHGVDCCCPVRSAAFRYGVLQGDAGRSRALRRGAVFQLKARVCVNGHRMQRSAIGSRYANYCKPLPASKDLRNDHGGFRGVGDKLWHGAKRAVEQLARNSRQNDVLVTAHGFREGMQ